MASELRHADALQTVTADALERTDPTLSANADSPPPKRSWRLGTDADLYRHLANYDRTPMIAELGRWLDNGPSEAAISELAEKAPHKWSAAVKTLANVAGFAERSESIGVTAIVDMSDSQLATALRDKLSKLGLADADLARVIDHEPKR